MLVTDTKNRAGLIQSEGALVDAAAFTVADKQKLLTLVKFSKPQTLMKKQQ